METDTAGNTIETLKPCRCGLTGGCSYCCPYIFNVEPEEVPLVPEDNQDGIVEFFKNNFGT